MTWFLPENWEPILRPSVPLLEIFIRGSVMYLALFILLRLVVKREVGSVGISDLLVVVLIADAAQNAMADDYTSISDGILLVSTIIAWSWIVDWVAMRSRFMERLVSPPPLLLIRNGELLYRNMRKELITEDELKSKLRLLGIEDMSVVREAYMEPDGQISALTSGDRDPRRRGKRRRSK